MNDMTPMIKQYLTIKSEHADAILFFRLGDFYEMFFDDAKTASRILGLTLTSRGTYNDQKIPMCGFPHHAARSYIAKLIESGWKVAICEQAEDPKESKGIVRREVIRVVTPGSVIEEGIVDKESNIYMASISGSEGFYGLAHADLSTGEFRVTEVEAWADVLAELGRIKPAEVLVLEKHALAKQRGISAYRLETLRSDAFEEANAYSLLTEQLGVKSLAPFGCDNMPQGIIAAGALVHYLKATQKVNPEHIKELTTYRLGDFMFLDESTSANLELFRTMRRQTLKGSLYQILNKTSTPMGARQLKRWIGYPLIDLHRIRRRLAAVATFREDRILREEIKERLDGIYDIERLNGRISLGRANGRDLLALLCSVQSLPGIKGMISGSASELLSEMGEEMDTLEDIGALIQKSICDDPPVSIKEGGLVREGYHEELDRLIEATRNGKAWIAELGATEQRRTGISSLKVGYNRVFGYYIEVSKANLHLVPPDYIRKQTLANGERYVTEKLKEYEELVLGAEEKRIVLEFEIFEDIRLKVALENKRISTSAKIVGELDTLVSLAEAAESYGYLCPEVNNGGVIEVVDGRHPVIEQTVKEEEFVPNDIYLDDEKQQLLIITGPNMAGKSTVLRQAALTVLMAQMGSFVPASKAIIGVVDRIFTRIGASDDLAKGQSTFMVEMNETANILRHTTTKSLVILDEIGRGTSTYDGVSIAWAVAEALHDREGKGVKTLFATHYHELTELVAGKERVKNFNISVKEWNDRIIFLRKLVPGGTSRSYGIQVARLAGLPSAVIERAREILHNLEGNETGEGEARFKSFRENKEQKESPQLSLFGAQDERLTKWIRGLDISSMTPLEALIELHKLKSTVDQQPS
jgi:DNA mismatch repair protein MutS